MIPMNEALEIVQNDARDMLVNQLYDEKRDIPMRATSHSDLWPGDRWVEAYLAIDEPELAQKVMDTVTKSIRPDGSLPHLMQGSHIRGGVETRWIDRQIYKIQGNGALKLPNGEWVTKSYGMPTLALSALVLAEHGLEHPDIEQVARSITALYDARVNQDGLIEAHRLDELTNSAGRIAQKLSEEGTAVDPAVNALAISNSNALSQLIGTSRFTDSVREVRGRAQKQTTALYRVLDKNREQRHLQVEEVLAFARLGDTLTEAELRGAFEAPSPEDTHPERSNLTLAECLEIARLTRYAEASNVYLQRVIPRIAKLGSAGLTRFENVMPGANAAANKYGRKQVWLPTAAEVAQIESV